MVSAKAKLQTWYSDALFLIFDYITVWDSWEYLWFVQWYEARHWPRTVEETEEALNVITIKTMKLINVNLSGDGWPCYFWVTWTIFFLLFSFRSTLYRNATSCSTHQSSRRKKSSHTNYHICKEIIDCGGVFREDFKKIHITKLNNRINSGTFSKQTKLNFDLMLIPSRLNIRKWPRQEEKKGAELCLIMQKRCSIMITREYLKWSEYIYLIDI